LATTLLKAEIHSSVQTRNLSADGNRVFFSTPDKLKATDTNGVEDVYEWEADGSGTCHGESENGGCLYLISSGTSPLPSKLLDASESGGDVFFFTSQPLVGQDQDELVDVYDAREGGGIAAQNPAPESICASGEACKPPLGAPPASTSPAAPSGEGNAPPAKVVCKKGTKRVKRHGSYVCVRPKPRKKAACRKRSGCRKNGPGKKAGTGKKKKPHHTNREAH
jgi:hypothetical protein